MKEKIKRLWEFITFDIRWVLIYFIMEPIEEIKSAYSSFKENVKKTTRPRGLLNVFMIFAFIFAFKRDIFFMIVCLMLGILSHLFFIYISGNHIRYMRKKKEKKIGVEYGKQLNK